MMELGLTTASFGPSLPGRNHFGISMHSEANMIESIPPKTNQSSVNNTNTSSTTGGFPCQLYQMLEDAEVKGFDHIVSWLPCGTALKVHSQKEFEREGIMSRYFKQTRYKSFQKQLNIYRFHRSANGETKGAYSHELLRRGRRDLCKQIARPRPNTRKDSVSSESDRFNNHTVTTEDLAEETFGVLISDKVAVQKGGTSTSSSTSTTLVAGDFARRDSGSATNERTTRGLLLTPDDIVDEIIVTFGNKSVAPKDELFGTNLLGLFDDGM